MLLQAAESASDKQDKSLEIVPEDKEATIDYLQKALIEHQVRK